MLWQSILGLVMSKALAGAGANIAVASRDEGMNRIAVDEIKNEYKADCLELVCDVTSEQVCSKPLLKW